MSQILLYQSEDGRTKLDVRLENETLWLNQKQLTELFGKAKGTISEHIKHIFEDGELEEISVVRLFRTTATDGKIYEVSHYNLDMVLALGFCVRSPMAVRFRQWAADKLKEYITKGFVLDDDRLKNPHRGRRLFLGYRLRRSHLLHLPGLLPRQDRLGETRQSPQRHHRSGSLRSLLWHQEPAFPHRRAQTGGDQVDRSTRERSDAGSHISAMKEDSREAAKERSKEEETP